MLSERSFSDVVQDIVANLQEMVRSEVRLAKVELREEAEKAARAGKAMGAGIVLALYAGAFLLLGAVFALSLVMAAWMAALLVGAGVGIIAAIMIGAGSKRLKQVHTPERTIATVKENVTWLKRQTR